MSRIYIVARGVCIYLIGVQEKMGKISIWRNNNPQFPQLGEIRKLTDVKSSQNTKQVKYEENYGEAHHNEITECQK